MQSTVIDSTVCRPSGQPSVPYLTCARLALFAAFLALGACGQVVESTLRDAGFEDSGPGSGLAFTDDSLANGFGEATYTGTEWAGDHVQLRPGTSTGELVSRVMDAGRKDAVWTSMTWRPRAPYAKPLPDGLVGDGGYAEGNIDMTGNVLLLRLNEPSPMSSGQFIVDESGRYNTAIMMTEGNAVMATPGRFDLALLDTTNSYAYIDLAATDDFDFGESDFTWALWVKTTQSCADDNKVYLGGDGAGAERVHLWLGCGDTSRWSICPAGEPGGRAAGTFRSVHSAADGASFCGQTIINDGKWHHLAIVKAGHAPGTLMLYVDGQLEASVNASFIAPLTFANDPQFTLGAFTGNTANYQAAGAFDEVAIWRRALSGDEIASMYRRASLRLRFQVRLCNDAQCSAEWSFVGPGSSSRFFYTDSSLIYQLDGTIPVQLPQLRGQYFQYKAYFESDIPNESPILDEVTVKAVY